MAEYKLSYTAEEINRRLGTIDKLVSTVNGVVPDNNGNVNIEVSSGAYSWNDLTDKPIILTESDVSVLINEALGVIENGTY